MVKLKDVLFIVLMMVAIYSCVYLIQFSKTQSNACLSNPFQYGVDKLAENEGVSVMCAVNPQTSNANCATSDNRIKTFIGVPKK